MALPASPGAAKQHTLENERRWSPSTTALWKTTAKHLGAYLRHRLDVLLVVQLGYHLSFLHRIGEITIEFIC